MKLFAKMKKYENKYSGSMGKDHFEFSASGYSRIMDIMHGQIPEVHSFGIITAENPKSTELPADENNRRNEELRKRLADGHWGFFQIKGKYGNFENPYFVMNISREYLQELANDYKQDSFIYGENWGGKNKIVFYLIEHGEVKGRRTLVHRVEKGVKDFYSEYKGRKFQIPFIENDEYVKEDVTGITGGVPGYSNLIHPDRLSYTLSELSGLPEEYQKDIATIQKASARIGGWIQGKLCANFSLFGSLAESLSGLNRVSHALKALRKED